VRGLRAAATSMFNWALAGTFIGYGGLCQDLGLSVWWAGLSTALIFAGPAQVILVTTLGTGTLLQAAIAVTLSAIRLLPMTVSLLPILKTGRTRTRDLILPAHFVAVSMWIVSLQLAPKEPREDRIAFCNGLGVFMTITATGGTVLGYLLAAELPPLFAAGLLFLTPMMFLVSTAKNSVMLSDRLAFIFGLVLTPVLVLAKVDLALLYGALIGGTLAYGIHRVREARR